MNYFKLYEKFDSLAHYIFRTRFARQHSERQLKDAKVNYNNWKPLSKHQKNEIAAYWGIKHAVKSDFMTHEIMMNVKGEFDVRYCPEKIFRVYLDPFLENRKLTLAWDDKNYFERHQPSLPFPYACIRNINGYFLDHDYQPVSREDAKSIILQNLPVIIKPSMLSGEGKNLRLISNKEEADKILPLYDKDYIVQRFIAQCDELKKMSPQCVNSMRLITAIVDNKPVLLKKHLLCNTTDSIAVNAAATPGTGCVIIGINNDGTLFETGYYENAKRLKTLPSGFTFGGMQIPSFNEVVKFALEAHKSMPLMRIIGWDVTVDENKNPVFIEWNLRGIEIYHSQLSQGPLFGSYSDYFADIAKTFIKQGY